MFLWLAVSACRGCWFRAVGKLTLPNGLSYLRLFGGGRIYSDPFLSETNFVPPRFFDLKVSG
jgi:hypothetical protein